MKTFTTRLPLGWEHRIDEIAREAGEPIQWVAMAAFGLLFEYGSVEKSADAASVFIRKMRRNRREVSALYARPPVEDEDSIVEHLKSEISREESREAVRRKGKPA